MREADWMPFAVYVTAVVGVLALMAIFR